MSSERPKQNSQHAETRDHLPSNSLAQSPTFPVRIVAHALRQCYFCVLFVALFLMSFSLSLSLVAFFVCVGGVFGFK